MSYFEMFSWIFWERKRTETERGTERGMEDDEEGLSWIEEVILEDKTGRTEQILETLEIVVVVAMLQLLLLIVDIEAVVFVTETKLSLKFCVETFFKEGKKLNNFGVLNKILSKLFTLDFFGDEQERLAEAPA